MPSHKLPGVSRGWVSWSGRGVMLLGLLTQKPCAMRAAVQRRVLPQALVPCQLTPTLHRNLDRGQGGGHGIGDRLRARGVGRRRGAGLR